ncbi:Rqc2 family fibronectin-binding protein [Neomoorella humiferrea]|uniref:Rqc2 homolog RqcH n=1 Tax=Neomoorella humiferrea TaxID=676965 RepID=A0A2T0AMP6_9FIRM|nr:NFACT RNA binding domain-containing protein [Moorella humiferrea]PRR70151.1 DNA topoisomerase VI subunit B [Moorella humiferrea]
MACDGLFLAAVREELRESVGSRVDRIFQPEKETIIIHLRRGRETRKLLLCSLADQARVHFTTASFTNPASPPLFCMVLRKHLEGGILEAVEQPNLERILSFRFQTTDELGRPTTRLLIIEVMGKHANIILLDPSNTIIDAARRYTHAVSRYREVLPGRPYIPPPPQVKADPRNLEMDAFIRLMWENSWDIPLERLLVEKIAGVGPQTAREIICRAGLPAETTLEGCGEYELTRLYRAVQEIAAAVCPQGWRPVVIMEREGETLAFAAFELFQFEGLSRQFMATPSAACDFFYQVRRERQLLEATRRSLEHVIDRELKRCYKKEGLQAASVAEAADAEKFRLAGELITANIYRLEKGQISFTTPNFYDPHGAEITIELDPSLTPAENAQRYFHRYNKARNAARLAKEQLEQTRTEIAYLESVAQALEMATNFDDLAEIRRELRRAGYITEEKEKDKPGKKSEKKEAARPSTPMEFTSPDGFKILVGRNNRQNDWLTLKLAGPDDIWLHAKDIPGSHVVIRTGGREVPAATLEMAARLAARYSRAGGSSRVPVDYTLVKNVRKPPGAKPGMVIYDHQRTVYVAPWE